tara:strand:+ start:31731 stop:32339 length:609 start_codon:yes stop_codon:yes gene_type:complete
VNSIKPVFVLLNGLPPTNFEIANSYDLICATDGAYDHLVDKEITPNLVSGDFDSISNIPKDIPTLHTPDQDYTDFEKLLHHLHQEGHEEIHVYGASGKEQDHFLGNIHVALVWKEQLNIVFYDDYGTHRLIPKSFQASNVKGKNVSIYPFPEAEEISTEGLEFPLNGEALKIGKRIGIRNKAINDQIQINYTKGNLLVFISH